jgi:hypothetical protein
LGTSLEGFNLILEWSQTAYNNGFEFHSKHPSCKNFVDQLQTMVGLPCPQPVTIPLETTVGAKDEDKRITVWQYDFYSQFTRIMNSEKLMEKENIICNDVLKPYDQYIPSKTVNKSQDTYLYQNAMKQLILNPTKDIVIGVDIYADSTWCDVLGRYNCEPVVATFSIFRRNIRHTPNAQVLLGFITDMDHKSSAEGDCAVKDSMFKGIKYRNYHHQLDVLLAGLQKLQRGFSCNMNLYHLSEICNVILPILTIIGDGKSQDMMVGRYGTQHLKTGHQMWMCDCTSSDADNHIKTCLLMNKSTICSYSGNALGFYMPKIDIISKLLPVKDVCLKLKQISQYVGDNSFIMYLK